jgi:hypothetical protein
MDNLRWGLVAIILVPTTLLALVNAGIACRNIIFFTERSPSPIPVIGTIGCVLGLVLVPRSESVLSTGILAAFVLLAILDSSWGLASGLNRLRSIITGKHPS